MKNIDRQDHLSQAQSLLTQAENGQPLQKNQRVFLKRLQRSLQSHDSRAKDYAGYETEDLIPAHTAILDRLNANIEAFNGIIIEGSPRQRFINKKIRAREMLQARIRENPSYL